ncbi:MAG: hypothetical protein ACLS37_11405 [Alistipes sp.]
MAANAEHMRRAGIYVLPCISVNNSNSLCEAMMLGCLHPRLSGNRAGGNDGQEVFGGAGWRPWALAGASKSCR